MGGFNLERALEVEPRFLEPEYPFEWAGVYRLTAGGHEPRAGRELRQRPGVEVRVHGIGGWHEFLST